MTLKKPNDILTYLGRDGQEFIALQNPNYVFAEYDFCPLAAKIARPREKILAVVQDMDGTTTTTENLCLHSLETMIRQFMGKLSPADWSGLDQKRDYPHIIGNSTTKHVEYLIKTYQNKMNYDFFRKAYLRSALQTLMLGKDEGRKREVTSNLIHFKCRNILTDDRVKDWLSSDAAGDVPSEIERLISDFSNHIDVTTFSDLVRAAVDIYYQRYHEILYKIDTDDIADLRQLLPAGKSAFIEPMPGVAAFLAAAKGWLGEDLSLLYDELRAAVSKGDNRDIQLNELRQLGRYLEQNPLKIAIVTSSIEYEANIVLSEIFRILKRQVEQWPVRDDRKENIAHHFSAYKNVFDSIITASDSSEIRLKPHRDLYSLALHQLGISKSDFDKVIGFEDSESGTIAIRAAGIGLCVAVPFADTQGHSLDHASYILEHGLPEAILRYHLFLSKDTTINHH